MNKTMETARVIYFGFVSNKHGESFRVIESQRVRGWQARLRAAVRIISMLTCAWCITGFESRQNTRITTLRLDPTVIVEVY